MAINYITPAGLLNYYDKRRVLQIASDEGAVAVEADLSNTASAAYVRIINGIRAACGDIDSHCQRGKRYTRATLEAIVTEADAAPSDETKQKRAGPIRQMAADLTFGHMMARRGYSAQTMKNLAPRYEDALVSLERLANGEQVFDLDANIDAGKPSRTQIGKNNLYRPSVDNPIFGVWPDSPYGGGMYGWFGRW
jgi:hypothetical protein